MQYVCSSCSLSRSMARARDATRMAARMVTCCGVRATMRGYIVQ